MGKGSVGERLIILQAMLQNPDLKAFAQHHHATNAPTYVKDRVCIMGDAAHCMTPWQGSGASQAIEDGKHSPFSPPSYPSTNHHTNTPQH